MSGALENCKLGSCHYVISLESKNASVLLQRPLRLIHLAPCGMPAILVVLHYFHFLLTYFWNKAKLIILFGSQKNICKLSIVKKAR